MGPNVLKTKHMAKNKTEFQKKNCYEICAFVIGF